MTMKKWVVCLCLVLASLDVLAVLKTHGICPEEAMPVPGSLTGDSLANFTEFFSVLTPYIEAVTKNKAKKLSRQWLEDVSGNGFDRQGLAQEKTEPTQKLRQQRFDTWDATYDHVMLIYGKAVDKYGRKYYMVKNSWGDTGNYHGIWYMRDKYIALNTTYIFLNRHALTAEAFHTQ